MTELNNKENAAYVCCGTGVNISIFRTYLVCLGVGLFVGPRSIHVSEHNHIQVLDAYISTTIAGPCGAGNGVDYRYSNDEGPKCTQLVYLLTSVCQWPWMLTGVNMGSQLEAVMVVVCPSAV